MIDLDHHRHELQES
jgi:hypothetical protein